MSLNRLINLLKYIHQTDSTAKSTLTVDGKPVTIITRREAANMQHSTEWQWIKWLYKEDWHKHVVRLLAIIGILVMAFFTGLLNELGRTVVKWFS